MNSAIFHPGQLIAQGRYRIDRLLGEGGMGAVYEATELTLERKVALKVLLPELSQHPTARQRMEAEAKAMARLNSPHVVRVNTVFDEGGLLVIDLEFMAGGSLAEKLDGRGVDEATARDWISQILKGLEALHKVGLVHRDLKPANVLLDEHGVLKVTDLGIAQDSQRTGGLKTRHDANLGTAEYMAPEQVQSAATVDSRADVYAAGVMLYEFLTGRVPFSGEDWAVKAAQVRDLPDLAGLQATSAQVSAVLAVALAKQPDQRFRTANAMAEALATPTANSSVAEPERPRNQSAQAPESGKAGSEAKPSGLPRAALIFAASVALLLLGVGGWKYTSGSEERAAQAEALERGQGVSGDRPQVGTPTEGEAAVQGGAPGIPAAVADKVPPSPQTKLIGKWGIDVEKLGDMEEIKKMPANQRKKAIEMAKNFAGSMSFEFTDEKLIMEAMGQRKEGTYKVTKVEGTKLTIEATLDGKTETLEAVVTGDGVILGKDKEKFALRRKK